jgi:hypothetical protein
MGSTKRSHKTYSRLYTSFRWNPINHTREEKSRAQFILIEHEIHESFL